MKPKIKCGIIKENMLLKIPVCDSKGNRCLFFCGAGKNVKLESGKYKMAKDLVVGDKIQNRGKITKVGVAKICR